MFPAAARAAGIVRRDVPGADAPLIRTTTEFIGRVRTRELDKAPGLAETIDWVAALCALGVTDLTDGDVLRTLGTIAKTPDDRLTVAAALPPPQETP